MTEHTHSIHVLMVDDEVEFTVATSRLLERRGFSVTVVHSGEEALAILPEIQPEVVLLDIRMPGMDGEEAFDQIQQQRPNLPIIVLTGHGAIPQAFRMSKGGVFDYLGKPCEIEELMEKLTAAVNRDVNATAEPRPEPPEFAGEAPSVLLVDDEEELLDSLKTVLQRRRMEVYVARHGSEALDMLNDTWIDVVVLDIKMPGISGLEVLKRIKAIRPDVEILLLTGHPNIGNAMEGIKFGALEYLVKPPDMDALIRAINRAFKQRKETFEKRQQETIRDVLDRGPVD